MRQHRAMRNFEFWVLNSISTSSYSGGKWKIIFSQHRGHREFFSLHRSGGTDQCKPLIPAGIIYDIFRSSISLHKNSPAHAILILHAYFLAIV